MAEWKRVKVNFPTTKLGSHIEPIKRTVSEVNDDRNHTVYGVTNTEGITITGKEASKDISNYIVLEKDCFAYNPYRVNVGSIGINDKSLQGCVSPAYVVFKSKETLNPLFLFHYLKSDYGNHLINWYGNRGGVRNALRYDDLCKIDIPDISRKEQDALLIKLEAFKEKNDALDAELAHQLDLLARLRQAILQEAVQGQLTADWRAAHPVAPGDPQTDAAALLAQIRAEKARRIADGTLKKEKPLPPVREDEQPFALPVGWVWCRLGDCGLFQRGKSKHRPRNDPRLFENGRYPFVQTGDIAQSKKTGFLIKTWTSYYNDVGLSQSRIWPKGTLCITIAANIAETGFLTFDACIPDSVVGFISLSDPIISKYIQYYFSLSKDEIEKYAPATAQKNINLGIINELLFPLPPEQEQQAIVAKVDALLALLNDLTQQVRERRAQAAWLQQAVLREAFARKDDSHVTE